MLEILQFDADTYDLDGLVGKSEMAGADLIFMTYEEETETYYIDRMEGRKYDSTFGRLMMRIKHYLSRDENNGLFLLVAHLQEGIVDLFDGSHLKKQVMPIGDLDVEGDYFYGIMVQCENDEYVFREVIYLNGNYEGDGRASVIQNAGALSDLIYDFILDFQ